MLVPKITVPVKVFNKSVTTSAVNISLAVLFEICEIPLARSMLYVLTAVTTNPEEVPPPTQDVALPIPKVPTKS